METIKSVNTSQEQIISDILKLHSKDGWVDLDPTYSKGQFYKSGLVPQPLIKSDLEPQTEDTIQSNSDNLSFLENESINTIMFDPPFVIVGRGLTHKTNKEGSSKIAKRFGGYGNFEDLKKHYYNSLKEFYRVLKPNGIVVFKFQNTVSGGKQHFTHYFVLKSALELGFYPKDEFVLHNKSKLTSFGGRWKTQRHTMKHHSFFVVLEKSNKKVSYDIQD